VGGVGSAASILPCAIEAGGASPAPSSHLRCGDIEYFVGVYRVIECLGAWGVVSAVLGIPRRLGGSVSRVPWQQTDLSDPRAPRLRCAPADLKTRRSRRRARP
jgi:hypothetical protein